MVTPNQSSQDNSYSSDEHNEEDDDIILLGQPKSKPMDASDLIIEVTNEAIATAPDILAVPDEDDDDDDDILLLTNPSGTYRVPQELVGAHSHSSNELDEAPTTAVQHDTFTSEEENPLYKKVEDSSTEEVFLEPQYHSAPETWLPPNTEVPRTRAPDTQPPASRSYSESMDAITAAIDLESLPSPMTLLSPVFANDASQPDASSEAALILNDWLSHEQAEQSQTSLMSMGISDSSVSLSEISSLLEDDGFPVPLPLSNEPVGPSEENLRGMYQPIGKEHPRYKQIQQIRQVLSEFTQTCSRACCFLHVDGMLIGLAALGKGRIHEKIEELLFPVDVQSQLTSAVQQQQLYKGPIGDTAMDHIIAACLGGATPRSVAILPIVQNGQTRAVYYLDDGGEDNFLLSERTLEPIIKKASTLDYRWNPPQIDELLGQFLQD